jgi:hypothetical protein
MPYEGEFAQYRSLNRIAQTDRVRHLLAKARIAPVDASATATLTPRPAPQAAASLPEFIVAIDGSYAEVPVKNGYPGAHVGYVTVASVLLNLADLGRLDEARPIDPVAFRTTEQAATVDSALPGSNVVIRDHRNAVTAFREAVFEVFHDTIVDADDPTTLLETFNALLAYKPAAAGQTCPYECDGCALRFPIGPAVTTCTCAQKRVVYPTDALRIHERFNDVGTNGEAFGLVMTVWERVLLVHLLRCFERRDWLHGLGKLAFFVDGPLGVFGPPAWLSAAISRELKRINALVRSKTGHDLLIVGVEKSGAFVAHFDEIDESETPGERRFPPGSYMLLTDKYIKERISLSSSDKRYGEDTYFGRKVFYKTSSGARLVPSIPFLDDQQDTLDSDDASLYPQFGNTCAILDRLVSSRYPNSLSPLISAHSHAAIPLHLGTKVLQQLARALMERTR